MGKIVLIGDSIIHNMPKSLIGSGTDTIYNRGLDNIGVGVYRECALPHIEYRRSDVIVVLIGVNNIIRPDCDYDNKETLDDLIEKIKFLINDIVDGSKGEIIVQSIYPTNNIIYNKQIEYVNEAISKYCADIDVYYMNFYNDLLLDKTINKKYSHDGLRLNYEGYELVAKKLNKRIEELRRNTR